MVKKIGLLGLTEGNGHPYSWGAIINGYNSKALKNANWDVIYNYIRKRDMSEFGLGDSQITHIWTQDVNLSDNLAKAIKVENVVINYKDMISEVDSVIIARDDYENHLTMAMPFLEAGLKVFIDKPLTLDIEELIFLKKYLQNGQLMSIAGLRFAMELDDVRSNLQELGKIKLIQSAVINEWERYGIHIIDGVLGVINEKPISIEYVPNGAELYVITFKSGIKWTINILGDAPKTFSIKIIGEYKKVDIEIEDNFSMFRRMLYRFITLVEKDEQTFPYENTLISICLLIGGKMAREQNNIIYLSELYILLGIEG